LTEERLKDELPRRGSAQIKRDYAARAHGFAPLAPDIKNGEMARYARSFHTELSDDRRQVALHSRFRVRLLRDAGSVQATSQEYQERDAGGKSKGHERLT
jgi:hypothetical protein